MRTLIAGLCLLGASAVHAAPAAPVVTVGASNIKQLQFDWDAVPQANYYELWFRADAHPQWVKRAETPAQTPRFRANVAVHLMNWAEAAYRVAACNPSGCASSAEVGVDGLARDVTGFFKPTAAGNNHFFGHTVALSADGLTMAVLSGESMEGFLEDVAVVHVFRRNSPSAGWFREARLLPGPFTIPTSLQWNTSEPFDGTQLALSANGNLLVLAEPGEDVDRVTGPADSGAVYLFRRSGNSWSQAQKLTGSASAHNRFGRYVDLDDAGRTLAITHEYRGGALEPGTVEIYRAAGTSTTFTHAATIVVPNEGGAAACSAVSLSGNGLLLGRICEFSATDQRFFQMLGSTGWNEIFREEAARADGMDLSFDGSALVVQIESSGAVVYDGSAANGWRFTGSIGPPNFGVRFSRPHAAISRDGKIIVNGYYRGGTARTGIVEIYEVDPEQGWILTHRVGPSSANPQWFGHSLALGDDGKVLAVGASFDSSAARGINGNPDDASAPERGAVWVY